MPDGSFARRVTCQGVQDDSFARRATRHGVQDDFEQPALRRGLGPLDQAADRLVGGGCKVRFTDQCGQDTLVELMTDGILLAAHRIIDFPVGQE
ncbi:hypothetical protein [Amycolatopsis jiangsuensis]|uniref:Uncharacterized protein n=1 Tax=Amycolatopsis jiangsuensis TaxID=1181879 RepID=A0A840IP23_9PSEU|nr:hypothetical protein [Amycolatopsis jiangsuensis]MBB4683107.1 hypothetical protein [Amycolatopsis jiangsuensis]